MKFKMGDFFSPIAINGTCVGLHWIQCKSHLEPSEQKNDWVLDGKKWDQS